MRRALVASLFALPACYTVHTAAVGPPVPARPPACAVDFSRARPQELAEAYEQVGVLCFAADDADWPEVAVAGRRSDVDRDAAYRPGRAHEVVRRQACSLGGDLVAPVGLCGRDHNVALGVWRRAQ